MKVYLAAPYASMPATREEARHFESAGHEVTARWLNGDEEGKGEAAGAQMDIDDIERADALVIYTFERGTKFTGGGRFVEMGYALALAKHVVVVGGRENVFCHLPRVAVVGDTLAAIALLGRHNAK